LSLELCAQVYCSPTTTYLPCRIISIRRWVPVSLTIQSTKLGLACKTTWPLLRINPRTIHIKRIVARSRRIIINLMLSRIKSLPRIPKGSFVMIAIDQILYFGRDGRDDYFEGCFGESAFDYFALVFAGAFVADLLCHAFNKVIMCSYILTK